VSTIRTQFYKETRELLPWWLGAMAAITAAGFLLRESHDFARGLTMLVFAAAACGLGGLSIGQEYSHRTLGALLAQPISRAAVLGIKLLVLAGFLLALGVTAFACLGVNAVRNSSGLPLALIVAVLGSGFFLGPWLSMVGRGPLAGMVFSIALPAAATVGVVLATVKWMPEWLDRDPGRFGPLFVWLVLFTLWTIGGVLTWTKFLRLQALEGSPGHVGLPAWLVQRPMAADQTQVRRRNPVWLMVRKELRLQQLTIAISALYVVISAGLMQSGQPDATDPLAWIYAVVIPIVIGGLASAEERHLGTASWQTLLPMASAWQWIIKAGVAVLLTIVLVSGLPSVVYQMGLGNAEVRRELLTASVCVCVAALYISSFTTSGIRAILTAGLALIFVFSVGAGLWGGLVMPMYRSLARVAHDVTPFALNYFQIGVWTQRLQYFEFYGLVVGGTALVLRFGGANHHSGDHSARRIGRQIAWVAGYLTVTWLIVTFARLLVWEAFTPATAHRMTPNVSSVRLQPVGGAAGDVGCLVVPARPYEFTQAFRCQSVPPGDFRLLVTPRANAAMDYRFGLMPLTVEGRDLTTIPFGTPPDVAVNGRVVAERGRALPAGLEVVTPEAVYEFAGRSMTTAAGPAAKVDADGRFHLPGGARPRVIRLKNLPPDWALKFMYTNSADFSDGSTTWLVMITAATGTIEGTVLRADRRPAHDGLVIVFPSDDSQRYRPLRELVRTTPVGADGRYTIAGLLPGAYRVAFAQGMADVAWDDPNAITALQPDSIPITVSAGTRATIDGTIPRADRGRR
jgi:ABC-type transport system involved in multi-copper enzyme maturation permease subunit